MGKNKNKNKSQAADRRVAGFIEKTANLAKRYQAELDADLMEE